MSIQWLARSFIGIAALSMGIGAAFDASGQERAPTDPAQSRQFSGGQCGPDEGHRLRD